MKHLIVAVLLLASFATVPVDAGDGFENISKEMTTLATCRAEFVSLANLDLQIAGVLAANQANERHVVDADLKTAEDALRGADQVDRLLREVMVPMIRDRTTMTPAEIAAFFDPKFMGALDEMGTTISETMNAAVVAEDKANDIVVLDALLRQQTTACHKLIAKIDRDHSI
jgi:hypothetical protein